MEARRELPAEAARRGPSPSGRFADVVRVGGCIASADTEQDIWLAVGDGATSLLGGDVCAVLRGEDAGVATLFGLGAGLDERKLARCIADRVVATSRAWTLAPRDVEELAADRGSAAHGIGVPVFARGEVAGVFCALRSAASGPFEDDAGELGGYIATLAGAALEKAAAFAHLRFQGSLLKRQSDAAIDGVTAQKRADLDQAAAAYARSLLAAAIDPLMLTGLDGKIRDVNAATEAATGVARAALIGADFATLFDEPGRAREGHERVLQGGSLHNLPLRIRHTSDALLDVLFSAAPFRDQHGAIVGVLATSRDVSERREVERLKSEFISTVSHELRTPLTSIRGALGLLEAGAVGELAPEGLETVHIARFNCERLIRLVNGILVLEKLDAGKVELAIEDVEAADLLTATTRAIEGLATTAGVTVEISCGTAGAVRADRDQITQVVTNLLSNAIKFSPRGGRVELGIEPGEPGRMRFTVRDAGPGIAEDQRHRLFGRFQQLDNRPSHAAPGSGLGLAISKAIVERHGGEIGVTSTLGAGSTFWFELPRSIDAAPERSLLVVEDDFTIACAIERVLVGAGYGVVHAATLEDARAALAAMTPAAVLLDLELPDGSGLDLFAEPALGDAPVVVLAARARGPGDPVDPRLVDWLERSVDVDRLFAALRRAVRGHEAAVALVVDDDASTRALVSAELASAGIACIEASDGAQAVHLVRTRLPDLVVLDVVMAGMDAFEVVYILRSGATSTTPLLVYSARDLTAEERGALSLGPTIHLTKALATRAEFLDGVRGLLARANAPADR